MLKFNNPCSQLWALNSACTFRCENVLPQARCQGDNECGWALPIAGAYCHGNRCGGAVRCGQGTGLRRQEQQGSSARDGQDQRLSGK